MTGTEGDYNPAGGIGEGEGGECKGKLAILQISLVKLTKENGASWISVHQVSNCFVLGNVLSSLRLFVPEGFCITRQCHVTLWFKP